MLRQPQQPTSQPANQPTNQPTNQASNQPTNQASKQATNQPTHRPTDQPTNQPTHFRYSQLGTWFLSFMGSWCWTSCLCLCRSRRCHDVSRGGGGGGGGVGAMWTFPRIVGFLPKSSHFNGVFHYKLTIHFGGKRPYFSETPMYITDAIYVFCCLVKETVLLNFCRWCACICFWKCPVDVYMFKYFIIFQYVLLKQHVGKFRRHLGKSTWVCRIPTVNEDVYLLSKMGIFHEFTECLLVGIVTPWRESCIVAIDVHHPTCMSSINSFFLPRRMRPSRVFTSLKGEMWAITLAFVSYIFLHYCPFQKKA